MVLRLRRVHDISNVAIGETRWHAPPMLVWVAGLGPGCRGGGGDGRIGDSHGCGGGEASRGGVWWRCVWRRLALEVCRGWN